MQIVLKQTKPAERKLGSLSIPIKQFLEVERNKTYSHWVTLFDFLEDDEYDGDLGVNDEERPRAYIRYSLVGEATSKYTKPATTKTITSVTEETKGGSRRITTTTKTTTSSYSHNFKQSPPRVGATLKHETYTQNEPEPERLGIIAQQRDPASEPLEQNRNDAERYSVRILEGDLRSDTRELAKELRGHQAEIFSQEDNRAKTLAHLDKLHRELQGEHVQDQITGFQLSRKEADIKLDIDVRKAAFGEQIKVLNNNIEVAGEALEQVKNEEARAKKDNQAAGETAARQEDIRAHGLTEESKGLRNENQNLRRQYDHNGTELGREQNDTSGLMRRHDDVTTAYNSTIEKYNKLLSEVELARIEAQKEADSVRTGISTEEYQNVSLSKGLSYSTNMSERLSDAAQIMKKQLKNLEEKYKAFLDNLTKIAKDQDKEAQNLQDALKKNSDSVKDLTSQLKNQNKEIESLHEEVDKENATGLNGRLSKLIDTLVHVDGKRRTCQETLENAQTNWSVKLQLFIDEASRRSREAAREKRMREIEKQINKIDQLTREIYRLQTEADRLENRLFTDANRDLVHQDLRKELEGISLKRRWAEDERRHSLNELETLLRLLRECDIREMQQSEIEQLTIEITEIKVVITRMSEEITILEKEIRVVDEKLEELHEILDEKNSEIDELNSILKQRLDRVKDLKRQLGKSTTNYNAAKGDLVDEMLAEYLSIAGNRVPVRRLGGGFYLFGTKKIYAKIMNGKLVVRVGGGYMVIDEFIKTYSEPELNKLHKLCEREGVDSIDQLDLEAIAGVGDKSPGGRSPGGRSPGGKTSPGRGGANKSFKSIAGASINGTKRSPKLNAKAVENARRLE